MEHSRVEVDRWTSFLDSEGVRVSDREWQLELELWLIRPTQSRPGWWQVKQSGGWSVVLPWEAAQMLWAGIKAHAEDYGGSPLEGDLGASPAPRLVVYPRLYNPRGKRRK